MSPAEMFNAYTTLLGKKCPLSLGWYKFNFNLTPDGDNPSGYFNSSASRELYLTYESIAGTISTSSLVDMIVVAEALNILLIQDNTAFLHYMT